MSDTPRTDAEYERLHQIYQNAERINGPLCCSFENDMRLCRQLERELNAAQAIIRQQQLLDEDIMRLRERVKRLEEAGDRLAAFTNPKSDRLAAWTKAKEAKP